MKKRFIKHLALAACLTVSFVYQGSSCFGQGTLIYRDRGAFETTIANLTGIRTDVNFQPPLPPGGIDDPVLGGVRYAPPLTISGITFNSGAWLHIRRVAPGDDRFLNSFDSLIPLTVDMNAPTLAFGADFSSWVSQVSSNFLATVTLDNGTEFTFTAPADPNFTFFGFVTTQPFSSLTFSDGGLIGPFHEEMLDNITVVTVPEPGVLALFTLGALLLGCRVGRKSRL